MQSKPQATSRPKPAVRLTAKERQAQQRQQQQLMVGIMGVVVILVVVAVVVVLTSHSAVTGSSADARYAGIPTGLTSSGPSSDITYPVPMPYLGSPDAAVKIEELGSFSCPICQNYHDKTFSAYFDEIKAGKLQFIFLPTTFTGDFYAVPGTKAAYCAAQQNKFWPMYDLLYDITSFNATAAQLMHLQGLAAQLNLDKAQFDSCFNSTAATDFVNTSNQYINVQRQLRATPSIFLYVKGQLILPSQTDSNQTPGNMSGMPLDQLRNLIDTSAKAS